MAAFIGMAQCAANALVAATQETLIQIVAAANHRVKVLEWGIFFDDSDVDAVPVAVVLQRQSDAGTSGANTPTKNDDSLAETLLTTARDACTVEPTSGDVVDMILCHPQTGFVRQYRVGEEVIVGGGDRVGVRATAPAGVNARAYIRFEE